jgi:hypothetical protein
MKRWRVLMAVLGTAVMSSCSPPVERSEPEPEPPPPTPTPTPAPTPHPATGAQARALQLYPDLAVKDSLFNRTFLELVEQYKVRYPRVMTEVDWPLTLANRTGQILGVNPMYNVPETPPPATPVVIYVTPKLGSSLDRGGYRSTPIYH